MDYQYGNIRGIHRSGTTVFVEILYNTTQHTLFIMSTGLCERTGLVVVVVVVIVVMVVAAVVVEAAAIEAASRVEREGGVRGSRCGGRAS